jgi:hypothetical protein
MANPYETRDPFAFIRAMWPTVDLYSRERELVMSVKNDRETYSVAGNKLGKDYTAGLINFGAFIHPAAFLLGDDELMPVPADGEFPNVKIITTSVTDDHLDDLWGEIDRFIRLAEYPLLVDDGGTLLYNHREIRRVVDGRTMKDSYLKSEVSKAGAAATSRAGHHADFTLITGDEASGLDDYVYDMAQGWAKRMLWIGNPNKCQNFFRRAIRAGDMVAT